jgi:hypothetical protein
LSIAVRHFLERGGAANGALEPAPLFVSDKPSRSITAAISPNAQIEVAATRLSALPSPFQSATAIRLFRPLEAKWSGE